MPKVPLTVRPVHKRRVKTEPVGPQRNEGKKVVDVQAGNGTTVPDVFAVDGVSVPSVLPRASGPGKLNAPGLLGVNTVSVAALQDATRIRAARVRPFAAMAAEAKARGLEVYVLGGGASSFAAHVKAGLQSESGDGRIRADRVLSDELSAFLNLATQDLDVVIARADGKPESVDDIAAFQAFVDQHLGSIEVDIRGMQTAKDDIHFPLTAGSPFFDEHHNSLDLLALHLGAGDTEAPLVDLAVLQGASRRTAGAVTAVDDLASGTIRLLLSDAHDRTPTGKTGNSPPVKHAMRALIKAVRHELTPDAATQTAMRRIFASWSGHVDTNDVVGRWMAKNLKKLVMDAMDLPGAFKLLEDVGALAALRKVDAPDLARLFNRRPFVSEAADGASTGRTAASLGIDKLWHITDDYEAFVAMSRTPLWRPNFLSSTGEAGDGTAAHYGAGVYFTRAGEAWGEASGKKTTGYIVEVKLDPAAKEGADFKRVTSDSGQEFIVVKKRAALTLDQQPLHALDLDNTLKMLLAPETATRLHVLEQLQERLLVLGADPTGRTEIAARLLQAAQDCDADTISSFVPILADARVRALAPGAVFALVKRSLARDDVMTALELLDTPTDAATLRAFAHDVMPLVDENSGIFINTFGERLFAMFSACPDALAPILKACDAPRSFVAAGLLHGDPVWVPQLVELARTLDADDRRMIRGWHGDALDKKGFAPLSRALGS